MDRLFGALSTALNLTLYDPPFESDESRAMISEALEALAEGSEALEEHDQLGPAYGHLKRSLARDAREAELRFRQGRYQGVRFLLTQLTSSCVACHTKLPGEGQFDLGERFVERARIKSLPTEQRARLLVAVRQFEAAMEVYEERFHSERVMPHEFLASGELSDYLEIALRVLDDGRRAQRTLEYLGARDDVNAFMASELARWIAVIDTFDADAARETRMATARRLIHEANRLNAFPLDRHGLVHFILASRCLLRHLDAHPDDVDPAEAYYLLGVCEAHISRSAWVSETEFYLESAVRADPASPFASLAVDFLDAYVEEQYRGSGGVMVPDDVRERIDSLRTMVDSSRQ
jgi:hypothetical protein